MNTARVTSLLTLETSAFQMILSTFPRSFGGVVQINRVIFNAPKPSFTALLLRWNKQLVQLEAIVDFRKLWACDVDWIEVDVVRI